MRHADFVPLDSAKNDIQPKAALSGNPDVIGLLLDHGAFIDQQSPILGHTALMDAVVCKHEDVVRLLLKRGARTAIRNHWHETALDIARRDGLDTIARLIEARNEADDDEVRAQTLVSAIKAGDLEEVERLIAAGAAVNERLPMVGSPDDDYTPLAIAAREGHADIVRALLEAGLEDGKKLKMLKRHLATSYNMTTEDYRRRWGLARDYPMVAPAYAAQRSALAKRIGLGRKRVAAPPAPDPTAARKATPRRVAGRRKVA